MSLLLAGLIAASASGAALVGRWLARRRDDAPVDATAKEDDPGPKTKSKPATETKLEGFPCQLGDVVMRLTGEEAWLAGGVVLSEEMPVAVLFVAPEAKQDTVLYARPVPRASIAWLSPVDAASVLLHGEPPNAIEHEGIRFERVRRLPLRTQRLGVGAPNVGDAVVVAEYASAGAERLVVLKATNGSSFAYRGLELEPSAYEVIASGRSTLDE
ncbi:hypothetical protein AKJ09_07864 [Labilithrix luteola]|uniref:DUF4178 domain-containing protein n=1 Tax=Labilithrix luteola TaxID=1391654 RepID=A0A0K1Q5V0_9BACT|nr:hypothetical protein [Labilithrix luteola]AKV01201.1 hypothetical protein AKJ09_07864 [Labilithrix luteola]